MNKETVLILGAGASFDYGYPTNEGLTAEICNFDESNPNWNLLCERDDNYIIGLKHIKKNLFESQSNSIDAWLAKKENRKSVNIGKILIAYFLSIKEKDDFKSQNGFFKDINNPKTNKKNWYRLLINAMSTDQFENFGSENEKLTIITFNYDRSLEFYLLTALKGMYPGYSDEEYLEQISKIDIFHVYGSIGEYLNYNSENYIAYGIDHNSEINKYKFNFIRQLEKRAENIKLIPEIRSNNDNEIINKLKNKLVNAINIYFIGFAYDKSNLKILGFPFQSKQQNVNMAGTVYNLEDGEISLAEQRAEIKTARNSQVKLKSYGDKCDAFSFFRKEVIKAFS